MNAGLVEQIVDAVLYEGYILYPYRASSVKNRQRWNFGGLYPRAYCETHPGSDAYRMQTECLVASAAAPVLDVRVRFLHVMARDVGRLIAPVREIPPGTTPAYHVVESLEVDGRLYPTWQESVERETHMPDLNLLKLVIHPSHHAFSFPASQAMEFLRDPDGDTFGVICRKQQQIDGSVDISVQQIAEQLFKIRVRICNETPLDNAATAGRDEALLRTMASTHTILGIRGGEFVSLLDPPDSLREIVAGCRNMGTWPVLVGRDQERDCLLSSPIILYDYPRIAPESAGNLYDGTEIDEILTLRIQALTDEEKWEMMQLDDRARALLERTDSISAPELARLHGTLRDVRQLEENRP